MEDGEVKVHVCDFFMLSISLAEVVNRVVKVLSLPSYAAIQQTNTRKALRKVVYEVSNLLCRIEIQGN